MLFKALAIISVISLAQQAVAAPANATGLADVKGTLNLMKRAGEDCADFQFMVNKST
jgi:hypothetical protein